MPCAADAVLRLHNGVKKKFQHVADLAGTYGIGAAAGGRITHECRVGLWLNIGRTDNRRANAVLRGIVESMRGTPSLDMFESLTEGAERAMAEHATAKAHEQFDGGTGNRFEGFE